MTDTAVERAEAMSRERATRLGAETSELTPKQEAFAQKYVELGCASDAYRYAYDADGMKDNAIWVNACKLLKHAKVSLRVAELREAHQERHDMSVDRLTDMAVRAYNLAMKDSVEAPAAAVAAVMGIAKLHGLIIDKSQNLNIVANFDSVLRARLNAAKALPAE